MFFSKENFQTLPDGQDRIVAAETANETIKTNGKVFYGRFLKDGSAVDFTTERKPTDSHVMIGIGITEMMAFAPKDAYINTTEPDKENEKKARELYVRQLELEVKKLRGSNEIR